MKYKVKDLAKLLVSLTKGVPKSELKPRIEEYANFLENIGAGSLLERILSLFHHEWNKANGIKTIELKSARPLPKNLVKELKERFPEGTEIKETVDEKLLSGLEIKFDDLLIDSTLKNRVQSLKNQILN